MTRRALLALALIAPVIAACSSDKPHRPATDLSGWYVRDIGDGREVIDVRPNGDYIHVVTIRGAPARSDAAHWHATGDSTIELNFYRDAADVGNGVARPDSASATIHPAAEGELELVVGGDTTSFIRRLRYGKQRGG